MKGLLWEKSKHVGKSERLDQERGSKEHCGDKRAGKIESGGERVFHI